MNKGCSPGKCVRPIHTGMPMATGKLPVGFRGASDGDPGAGILGFSRRIEVAV